MAFYLLLSVPAAFPIDLLAMRPKPDGDGCLSLTATPVHTIIGFSLLLIVSWVFSQPVF